MDVRRTVLWLVLCDGEGGTDVDVRRTVLWLILCDGEGGTDVDVRPTLGAGATALFAGHGPSLRGGREMFLHPSAIPSRPAS